MNDALDRREESGPGGRLDQVVFRWDGNQGRSSTGMAAVAHSCSAERAESLRRELGPLLWVPGPGPAPRASSVRVSSRAVGTVLLQRWPTLDRGGRPSTACHAVFGDADTLTPLHCLALVGNAWSDLAVAETAAGGLPTLDGARLRATAAKRLRKMFDELPVVKEPLTVVTAEWLRDPSRRLSLLAEKHDLPGWPRWNAAPLLYLGLLSVFGDWFGTEWSYATYDTVDTHPLRLTCVPEWSSQAAGARSLARIRLRPPAEKDIETAAAKEMVEYVLDRPGAAPGVPHLTGELLSGARLPRQERREALRRMLTARHAPAPAPAREEDRYATESRQGDRYAREGRENDRYANEPRQEDRYAREDREDDRYATEPRQEDRYAREVRENARYATEPRQEDRYARQDSQARHDQERRRLQEELLVHQRVDAAQSARLAARLRDLRDDPLLTLLCADGLPWASRDLVLDELARPERRRSRDEATAHALCTEVLRHNLYFRPGRPEADSPSAPEMRKRAAELFSWAVAPLVRDPHRAPDLRPLFNIVLKDGRGTGMEWLRSILVAPQSGRAPDLPPQLWQQVVADLLAHPVAVTAPGPAPAQAPAPAHVPPVAVPAPAPAPAPVPTSAPAKPPMPLPASYTPATASPPRTAPAPKPSAHPSPAPTGPEQEKPSLTSGFSDFLYGPWFAPMIGVLVVAVVIGLVVLVAR
ncbi:hypothetical protein ASD97_06780 [Streptomyces sp. Root63]|uniref:hypothetical protein n=1 Tax=unclassified Streptomyces TaxID=2593676 RepID=UPI0006F20A76|nr:MULTISPECIES: hypothetical protein [unclassified Streptomyces]KQX37555.1 hypothetical protein ASD29_10450 [Streptomyces sp. Root1295]KRA43377.1 hypothetical protein ASD97_06780 [Streptomyces sp. Root63]